MGRLGGHPHIVTVFDIGDEAGQPYLVSELMGGGDVEGLHRAGRRAPRRRWPIRCASPSRVCQALALRPRARHHPPRPQARQRLADQRRHGQAGRLRAGDGARQDPPEHAGHDRRHRRLHAAGAGARPHAGRAQRSLLARRDALRAGHRPAAVPRRRSRGDHHPAHQHRAGRAVLAQPATCPPAAGSADPAAAGQGPRRAAGERRRGAPGTGRPSRRHRSLPGHPAAAAATPTPTRWIGWPAGSSSAASRSWSELRAAFDGALSGRGRHRAAGRRAGHRQDAHWPRSWRPTLVCAARRCSGAAATSGRARRPTGPGCRSSAATSTTRDPQAAARRSWARAPPDIAQIVSEVREQLPGCRRRHRWSRSRPASASSTASPPSSAMPRAHQPLVLVLDDLHWADKPSLLLLQFVARELRAARLLLRRHLPRRRGRPPASAGPDARPN